MKNRRIQSGASLPLIVVCFIILTIIGIAAFLFVTMFGTSRQFSSAADAGALNVGKVALTEPFVKLSEVSDDAAMYFKGLGAGNEHDQINLSNINGIWGAALLVGLNYESMVNPGQGTVSIKSGKAQEQAKTNAIKMALAASDVAKVLKRKMENSNELKVAFKNFCDANYPGSKAEVTGTWGVRYADAGADSNYSINESQLPEGLSSELKAKIGAGSKLKGYTDLSIDKDIPELTYCFVPLAGKVHLVSDDRAKDKVANVAKSEFYVPNTFQTQARVFMENDKNNIGAVTVTSYAEAGDLVTRTPFISGFVRISNHPGMNSESNNIMVNSLRKSQPVRLTRVKTRREDGLHAIEYLNFQMLYGRSNGDGPSGGSDPLATLMDFPIWIVRDPNNPTGSPLRTSDGVAYVYGVRTTVMSLYESKIKGKTNGDPMPDAQPDPIYGGGNQWECLIAPLPDKYVSKDEKDITKLAKYINTNNAELIDETMIGLKPNKNVIADQWYSDLVYYLGPHDDGRNVYGSTAHPHIWSRRPKVDSGLAVKLCQSAPDLGYKSGWNDTDPSKGQQAPKVGYWLTSKESGNGPGADPFSGMLILGPGRGNVEVDHPAQFESARAGRVKELIFADEAPNFWSLAQMNEDAAAMGTNLSSQYSEELKFLHAGIISRLVTRLNQIAQLPPKDPSKPEDASKRTKITEADLKAFFLSSDANNPTLAMGQSAYIYIDKTLGKPEFGYLVCRTAGSTPKELTSSNVVVDGKPVGEALDKETERSANPFDVDTNSVAYLGPRYPNSEKLYNIREDWQFQQPFVNQQAASATVPAEGTATDMRWWAMYVLTPCTGASGGILCDLSLREFFNQPDAAAGWNGKQSQAGMPGPCATTLTSASGNFHGSRPIDCPCECFPDFVNAFLPDTATRTRIAFENAGKIKPRRAGIHGQPHGGGTPPPNDGEDNPTATRCKANCSHGGPC